MDAYSETAKKLKKTLSKKDQTLYDQIQKSWRAEEKLLYGESGTVDVIPVRILEKRSGANQTFK